jgi:replicative DNA helicase
MKTETIWERGLPADEMAEKVVLGALLTENDTAGILAALSPDDFSHNANSRVFRAAGAIAERGEAVDRLTVASELTKSAELQSVGGLSYLLDLDSSGLPGANVESWVRIVQDKAQLRRAIMGCSAAVEECLTGAVNASEAIAKLESLTKRLQEKAPTQSELMSVGAMAEKAGISAIFGDGTDSRITTPWQGLNQIIGGFEPGDLVVVGARPSMGKTVLGCQIAAGAATAGVRAAIFSIEMRNVPLIQRMISSLGAIPLHRVRSGGGMDSEERHRAHLALNEVIEQKNLLLSDTCSTVSAIRRVMLKAMRSAKIDLIFIDYLQLLAGMGGRRGRVEEVTEISRGIKLLGQEFGCVTIVASQLSRESEKEEREPRLSDLRDSGSIEQDADLVIFPHRIPGQLKDEQMVRTELIVAKQRNGRLGRTAVTFEKPFVRFV